MTTEPDRMQCSGTIGDSRACEDRARPGSRYCGRHIGQAPATPVTYLGECASVRYAYPMGRVHLRLLEHGAPIRLLCTGTRARPLGGPAPGALTCPRCRALALDAVARGELEPDELPRWNLGERNVDEARA